MADYEEYFGHYGPLWGGAADYGNYIEKIMHEQAAAYEEELERREQAAAYEGELENNKSKSDKKNFTSHKAFNKDIKDISDKEFLAFRNCFLTFFCRNKQTFLSAEELHQLIQALKTLSNLHSKIQATASLNSYVIKNNFPDEYEKLINDKNEFHRRILTKTIEDAIFVNNMTSKRIESYLKKIADNKA